MRERLFRGKRADSAERKDELNAWLSQAKYKKMKLGAFSLYDGKIVFTEEIGAELNVPRAFRVRAKQSDVCIWKFKRRHR